MGFINPLVIVTVLAVAVFCYWAGRRSARKTKLKTAPRTASQGSSATQPIAKPAVPSGDNLQGQVAIVTGGGTGLGRSMSLELARRGAKVILASRNQEHLDTVAAEIKAAGGEAATVALDVRDVNSVEAMVAQVTERFGRIDILINNAAGNFLCPAEKLTTNGWNAVVGIVLNGTWYCSSAVGKQMIKQGGGGSILNIVANYAWSGQPGVVHSCSAKAGVLAMTRTLAVEWAGYGIRTNAFAPGAMVTDGASANLKYDSAEAQDKIRKFIPVQRLTSADEMAKLAVNMLMPEASYINGEVICADGGAWLPRGFLDLNMGPAAQGK